MSLPTPPTYLGKVNLYYVLKLCLQQKLQFKQRKFFILSLKYASEAFNFSRWKRCLTAKDYWKLTSTLQQIF